MKDVTMSMKEYEEMKAQLKTYKEAIAAFRDGDCIVLKRNLYKGLEKEEVIETIIPYSEEMELIKAAMEAKDKAFGEMKYFGRRLDSMEQTLHMAFIGKHYPQDFNRKYDTYSDGLKDGRMRERLRMAEMSKSQMWKDLHGADRK